MKLERDAYLHWVLAALAAIKTRLRHDFWARITADLVSASDEDAVGAVNAFLKENKVELWADAEMVRIAGRCHDVLRPMGPAFFTDLETAGEVGLSARDRFMLLAIVHICIAGKEAEDIISCGWRPMVEHAKELGGLIDYWTAPRFPIPMDVPGLEPDESVVLRDLLRKVDGFENELLKTEKVVRQRRRTHSRKWAHDALSRLLVRQYVDAGGVISFKARRGSQQGGRPAGTFSALHLGGTSARRNS